MRSSFLFCVIAANASIVGYKTWLHPRSFCGIYFVTYQPGLRECAAEEEYSLHLRDQEKFKSLSKSAFHPRLLPWEVLHIMDVLCYARKQAVKNVKLRLKKFVICRNSPRSHVFISRRGNKKLREKMCSQNKSKLRCKLRSRTKGISQRHSR